MNINIDKKQLEELAIIVAELVMNKISDVDLNRNENDKEYMNKKEAAEYIGISLNTLEKYIHNGLKVIVMGDNVSTRLKKDTIDKFMIQNER